MPIYVYQCESCGHHDEDYQSIHDGPHTVCPVCSEATYRRVPQATHSTQQEFHTPIQMHSIALCHHDEIEAFQRRHPDTKISTNPDDPLYGVPIARSRHEKMAILGKEGYSEKN